MIQCWIALQRLWPSEMLVISLSLALNVVLLKFKQFSNLGVKMWDIYHVRYNDYRMDVCECVCVYTHTSVCVYWWACTLSSMADFI